MSQGVGLCTVVGVACGTTADIFGCGSDTRRRHARRSGAASRPHRVATVTTRSPGTSPGGPRRGTVLRASRASWRRRFSRSRGRRRTEVRARCRPGPESRSSRSPAIGRMANDASGQPPPDPASAETRPYPGSDRRDVPHRVGIARRASGSMLWMPTAASSIQATNSALRLHSPSMKARSSASVKGLVNAVCRPSRDDRVEHRHDGSRVAGPTPCGRRVPFGNAWSSTCQGTSGSGARRLRRPGRVDASRSRARSRRRRRAAPSG